MNGTATAERGTTASATTTATTTTAWGTATTVTTATTATTAAYWLLRVGAALCFIGHGAFGFITKAAWVPYFGVVGIPERWAYPMMPVVGGVDVLAAMWVLFAPRGIPLAYMVVWATWTAMLRPLAGEPVWETLERAGNYGVPLAMLALTGMPRTIRDLLPLRDAPVLRDDGLASATTILRWTTALLLVGHGALGALTVKAGLTAHYVAAALPAESTAIIGWFEIALGVAVASAPRVPLLLFVAAWKLATEWLWIVADAPAWEFVERAGSYVAPLALAALIVARRSLANPDLGRRVH